MRAVRVHANCTTLGVELCTLSVKKIIHTRLPVHACSQLKYTISIVGTVLNSGHTETLHGHYALVRIMCKRGRYGIECVCVYRKRSNYRTSLSEDALFYNAHYTTIHIKSGTLFLDFFFTGSIIRTITVPFITVKLP